MSLPLSSLLYNYYSKMQYTNTPQGGISTLVVYITTKFQNIFLGFLFLITAFQE